jgi:hypothetical protein
MEGWYSEKIDLKDIILKSLFTSIYNLADATKLPRKIRNFKRLLLVDCVESILKDYTQSAN